MPDSTIDYYDTHSDSFAADTVDADLSGTQSRFVRMLPAGGDVLDFGCGAGRDTKAFLGMGFRVDAADGSREMCRIAHEYTGIAVKQMYFQELDEAERYDGIWACASILHLSSAELPDVLRRMARALKGHGIIYASFKYGSFEGERRGRYFTDMTEESFSGMIKDIRELQTEEMWVTSDVRPGRGDEKWLNLILRKI
ncbi:MAG: class I SAM-dependent methyltransferase [Clostridia bacterium]|nr:class I SAM-dependent methyltransferase [Clostridia bacterium]